MNKKTRFVSLALMVLCVISLISFEIRPVRAAIFGYTGSGTSHWSIGGRITGTAFEIPEDGNPSSIVALIYCSSSAYNAKGAIYRNSDKALIAITSESSCPSGTNWVSFTLTTSPLLTSGTEYILVVWSAASWLNLRHINGATAETQQDQRSYGSFPSTMQIDYTYDDKSCIYCIYTVANAAPENDACTITDLDDSNNMYAQISGGYSIDYDGHDDDGYVDINYVLVNITQADAVRVSFKYTNSTNTFSIIDGDSEFTLDESSSASRAGTNINLTIVFHVQWDAIEEASIELKAVIVDSGSASDVDTMQTDYADIVTNLIVSGFACNDDRGDVSQALTFSGTVYYANNPSSSTATTFYPPDAEFSAIHIYDSEDNDEGNDTTVVNGAFSVNFNGPASVGTDTYNSYIDMSDEDYSDAEENPSDAFITDRIILLSLSSNDTAIPVNEYVEVYVTAKLEYDDHAVGSGDSLTIESLALSWDAGESRFEGSETKASAQSKTYDEGLGNEATYGITVVNMDVFSLTVEWYEEGEGEGGYRAGWFGAGVGILILCISIGGLIFFFGLRRKG